MNPIRYVTSLLVWMAHLGLGGGGGSAPPDTETPRRRAAIERINTLFGIGDPSIDRSQFESVTETGGIDTPVFSSTSFDEPGYRQALERAAAERKDRASAREAGYLEHAGNVENLQRSQVDEDYEQAARQLKMALARRGLTGSSVQSDQGSLLSRRRQEGYLSAGQAGQRAAEGLRGADERSRLSLIDQINAGLDADAASSSLLSNIEANRRSASATDLASRINNFFTGIGAIYENQGLASAVADERERRRRENLSAYLDPTKTYAGT